VLGILESERKVLDAERKEREGERKQAAETVEYLRNGRPIWRIVASRIRARLIRLLERRDALSALVYRIKVLFYRFRAFIYKIRTKLGLARIRIRLGLVKEDPPSDGSV
jgi:hypothetical protein